MHDALNTLSILGRDGSFECPRVYVGTQGFSIMGMRDPALRKKNLGTKKIDSQSYIVETHCLKDGGEGRGILNRSLDLCKQGQ